MLFILGIITGLLIAILIVLTMTYFRRMIEHKTTIIEKMIDGVGPKPQGFIVEPDSELEIVRRDIIANNRKHGRDTKLSELL